MTEQQDTYKHKGLREKLVQSIREKGIQDENVLNAMIQVPRHFFLDAAFDKIAYEDRAFQIGEDQTISQPYTVAYQTELLQVKKFHKVLEIGTGSAYQATILAELGAKVYTIERQRNLYNQVQKRYPFKRKYPLLKFYYGDGFQGLDIYAPYDRILVTAAAPYVPQALLDQLVVGGILVLPLGSDDVQIMTRLTKFSNQDIREEQFEQFNFVPMLSGRNHGK